MAKKKHFEILGEIAREDGNIKQSLGFMEAHKNGEDGWVKMWCDGNTIQEMFQDNSKYIPILILVDRKAYETKAEEESELEKIIADAKYYREEMWPLDNPKNQKP